ncbi:MAG: hypothetical protein V1720_18775 [bacterium]
MKEKNSNVFKHVIIIIMYAAFIFSTFVYLRNDIKNLNLQKDSLQAVINSENDQIEILLSEDIQSLITEPRIVRIASDSLLMVRAAGEFGSLPVNKKQVEQIETIVNQKYE